MESEEVARLQVLSDVRFVADSRRVGTVGVYCLEGPLLVGDVFTGADDDSGVEYTIHAEVVEIQYFDRLIGALEPVFSANVLLAGELGSIGKGWTVHAVRPSSP